MHIVIELFKIYFQWNLNLNMASKEFTLATKLCEAMEILRISIAKFIKLMEFSQDELHIILKLMEFTLQYHNELN
jgi:hypothetical protein